MKKFLSALVAAAMLPAISFAAEKGIEPITDTAGGAEITVSFIEKDEKGALKVDAFLENTKASADTYLVGIDVFDAGNERIAGYSGKKTVEPGERIPLKFYTDSSKGEDDISVVLKAYPEFAGGTVYVSPAGDDLSDGTKNSPVSSLGRALTVLTARSREREIENGEIILEGGTYGINGTVSIPENDGIQNLTIRSGSSLDRATLRGGLTVRGGAFSRVTDFNIMKKLSSAARGRVYSLDLSAYGITLDFSNGNNTSSDPIFTELYYKSEKQQIARFPNTGYMTGSVRIGSDSEDKRTTVKSDDIKIWANYNEGWARGWLLYEWDLVKGRIADVSQSVSPDPDPDITGNVLTFQKAFFGSIPENSQRPMTVKDKKFFVYNLLDEIDEEGEYAIENNVLYFYPPDDDIVDGSFETAEIMLNSDTNNMINIQSGNVTIENIDFENSKGLFINANADNITVAGCKFRKNGEHAVSIVGNNNLVSSCDFYELGGRGVYIAGGDVNSLTPSGSVLENCKFTKTGQTDRTNCPPVRLDGCGVTAIHNTISDAPHSGFTYSGNNHIIEYNDLYNCLTDNAEDAGIIYTGGTLSNLGTVIRKNYIHDSNGGLGAIYWDDWLSGQTALGNVIENVGRALLIHGGVCNTFSDNIVINAGWGVQIRGKSRNKVINGTTYNVWNEINGAYNAYANTFLGYLVGIPESNGAIPGVAWTSTAWQTAFGNVLKYVNNKTDDKASECVFANNYFVNVPSARAIYTYAGMGAGDITSSNNTISAASLNSSAQAAYDDVVSNSGIYLNEYRKEK